MGQSCTKDSIRNKNNSTLVSSGDDPHDLSGSAPKPNYRRPSMDEDEQTSSMLLSPNNFNDQKVLSHLSSGKKSRITRVVLTGGPCAGKSTALADLQKRVPQKFGLNVYCVPEAATMFVNAGLEWSDDPETTIAYQLTLLRMQINLEDSFYAIAKASKKPSLILCDRGTMDGRVYCSEKQFADLLKRGGYTLERLRDERYDAVIHMVTAATGAEEHYNFDNPARMENVAEAKVNDDKLREMYIGHPKIRVIDNSTGFDKKLDRVLSFIGEVTGNHQHCHRTKRYFVKAPIDVAAFPVAFTRVQLTITILNNSTSEETLMVMKRQQGDAILYFYQALRRAEGRPHSRHEHKITAREYVNLLTQRDPTRVDVVKENLAFMYETLYCELGVFESPKWVEGVALMYVEPTGSADDEGYTPQTYRGSISSQEVPPPTHQQQQQQQPTTTTTYDTNNGDAAPSAASTTGVAAPTSLTLALRRTSSNLENSLSVSADDSSAASPTVTNAKHHHRVRASIQLPPFLQIEKDISDDKYLSSFYVSHIEHGPEHAKIALDAVRQTLTCDAFALERSLNGMGGVGDSLASSTAAGSNGVPHVVVPPSHSALSPEDRPLAAVPEPFEE